MPTKVRFWDFIHGSPVLITLTYPGRELRHGYSWRHDEGWSAEYRTWSFDGERVTSVLDTDGCDCDGRLSTHQEASFAFGDQRAGNNCGESHNGKPIAYPKWEHERASQRDYSAEAMGY